MQGNDLDNSPTRRFWILADAVLRTEHREVQEKRFLRTVTRERDVTVPDLAALNKLWRYSAEFGVRLELVFIGPQAQDAVGTWDMLEKGAANPFSDWLAFETHTQLVEQIPYRSDVLGIVDVPTHSLYYGGKGMTMEAIP